jgi:PleD family two-component response regulator
VTDSAPTTILVLVNDIFFYTKVRDALKPQGYELDRVRSIGEVQPKMSTAKFQAAIIDMNDLKVDPFRMLELIQQGSPGHPIPVLAFANHEEVETWRRAKELGVTKIVSRNEFSARTKDLVSEVMTAVLS